MDGLAFLLTLDPDNPMPMAQFWHFHVLHVEKGSLKARATAADTHENPFGVVQGGFQATVLDMALGLVSISILDDVQVTKVGTTDLVVRYFAPVTALTGQLLIRANVLHKQGRQILAEAYLHDATDIRFAYAQSSSIITSR